jgi:hypothetical protein
MESAFGQVLSPTSVGSFKNLKSCYSLPTTSSTDALLSVSRLVHDKKSVLIDHSGLHLYDNSKKVLRSLNKFKSSNTLDLVLTAPEDNGVYSLLGNQIPDFISPKLRKRFIKTIQSYHTMHFKSLKELTEFFHRALGHPDLPTMLLMATSSSFTSWPKELTPSVIRKHFPSCSDCSIGNLSERPLPSPSETLTDIPSHTIIGAEFEIDIKGKYTAPDGKPVRSFDGSLYTFNGIDLASDYAYSASIASRVGLLLHVMRLRDFITASGKTLKVLRTDNEFLTIAIRSWCAQNHIKLLPSLPHRHNKTRRIERFHRSLI